MARVPTLPGEGEVLPRYVFVESLIPKARVLEVGAVSLTGGHSARFLVERGAASVLSVDADVQAVAHARSDPDVQVKGVEVSDASLETLGGQTFDLVLVHGVEERWLDANHLALLRRLLSRRGRLMLAVRSQGGLALADFGRRGSSSSRGGRPDDLVARLKGSFRCVDVATQTLFFGYSVAAEGRDDAETSLDETLSDRAAPAYWLFLCGIEPTPMSASSLTPLAGAMLEGLNARVESVLADPLGLGQELESEVDRKRIGELEARTQAAIEEAERAQLMAAQALAERDGLKAKLARPGNDEAEGLKAQVAGLSADRERLKTALGDANRRHETDEVHVTQVTAERDELTSRVSLAETELEAASAEVRRLTEERDQLVQQMSPLRQAAASVRELELERDALAGQLREATSEHEADAAELTEARAERDAALGRIRELEAASAAALVAAETRLRDVQAALDTERANREADRIDAAARIRAAADTAKPAGEGSDEARADADAAEELLFETNQQLDAARRHSQELEEELAERAAAFATTRDELVARIHALEKREADAAELKREVAERRNQLAREISYRVAAERAAWLAAERVKLLSAQPAAPARSPDPTELENARNEADQLLHALLERQAEVAKAEAAAAEAERRVKELKPRDN